MGETEGELIIITPDAARELRALADSEGPSILQLDAQPDDEGGYDCSVAIVSQMPEDAEVEEINGVTVAFQGMATTVFAGAVVGMTPEGDLVVELAQGDCEGCSDNGCGGGSCGLGG